MLLGATVTESNGMSITSQIIGRQIEQLRLIGLFLSLTGNVDEELPRIRNYYHVLKAGLHVASARALAPTPEAIPVIYNPSNWTSAQLCGYAGRDVEVTADELVASYIEMWLGQVRIPQITLAHFVKCALWYSETYGRDPLAGLLFLLDLYDHGFFVKWMVFADALDSYVRHHALGADLSFMEHATIADVALVNENLSRIGREYEKVGLDAGRLEALIAAVGDLTMSRMQHARQAQSLDDWLIREASVCGPAWWLGLIHPAAKSLDFGILTRRMLSHIEEISADLHGSVGRRNIQAEHELPPVWDLTDLADLAEGYRERYADGSWLDRMTEDRLLFPDCVRELIRPMGPEAFTSSKLPPEWRIPSEQLAFPLCLAHGRRASFARSSDFSSLLFESVGKAPASPQDRTASDPIARRRLLEMAEAALVDEASQITGASPEDELRLNNLRALYPWHPMLCRFAGILRGLRGDLDGAVESLQSCLLIEPDGVAHWMALARLAQFKAAADDTAVLGEIARLVANLPGGDQ